MEKNYELLRPFDLEAAKRGDAICWRDGDVIQDVTITSLGSVCGRWRSDDNERLWQDDELDNFRMAPLCWVEGKPVYKGDVSLAPPKIEREGFVCMTRLSKDMVAPHRAIANVIVRNGWIFDTYEEAQAWADTCKDVACIVQLKWEESVQQE